MGGEVIGDYFFEATLPFSLVLSPYGILKIGKTLANISNALVITMMMTGFMHNSSLGSD